jgi:hypothetical protein
MYPKQHAFREWLEKKEKLGRSAVDADLYYYYYFIGGENPVPA